jgi:N-acetylglucosamine kinase-like BadF-type ATPase
MLARTKNKFMILIADSGSTKTDWCLCKNGEIIQRIQTKGINPFYQSEVEITYEIEHELLPNLSSEMPEKLVFYGAGCSFPDKKVLVANAIGRLFPNIPIEIQSDLLGAARGLLLHKPGIACILGTGSNSCYYDGNEIVDNVSPLGFILGDEGSGASLSKIFVADCLKKQISGELRDEFMTQYNLSPALILESVYKKPFPNRFLAQFTPFLSKNMNNPEVYSIVLKGFEQFFVRNVQQYPYAEFDTSFVGSVAFYFKPVLEKAAENCGITIGKIVKSPMEGLVEYHDVVM